LAAISFGLFAAQRDGCPAPRPGHDGDDSDL